MERVDLLKGFLKGTRYVEARKIVFQDNATTAQRAIYFASELCGTWILVFLGCAGCVSLSGEPVPHEQISLTFGFAVMAGIQCFAYISGGHINPVVTITAAIVGQMPVIEVPVYFAGQFAGAIAGFGTLVALTPAKFLPTWKNTTEGLVRIPGVCSPGINSEINVFQGLLSEFTLSLVLVFLCGAVWDCKGRDKHDSVTIRFGLTVAALAMAGGQYSGANMNPARSFAPALFNNWWKDHWVYWLGPIAAALIGGFVCRFLFTNPEPEPKHTSEGIPLNDKA